MVINISDEVIHNIDILQHPKYSVKHFEILSLYWINMDFINFKYPVKIVPVLNNLLCAQSLCFQWISLVSRPQKSFIKCSQPLHNTERFQL